MWNLILGSTKVQWDHFLLLQDDKEKRRLELLERKKENQRLLDEESSKLKGKSQKESMPGGKVTRAQIEELLENEQLQKGQQELKPKGKAEIEDDDKVCSLE